MDTPTKVRFNEFRACDAFEYVEAYHNAVQEDEEAIRARLARLNGRMEKLTANGEEIDSYLLAAYRGYEHALVFRVVGELPTTVKLDDSVEAL